MVHSLEVHPEIEHRRQPGSECVTGAPEATGSRIGTTGGAQPTRLLCQTEKNFTSQTAVKSEVEGSSPVPSRRTSAQRERAHNPAHSSKNERDTEVSHQGKAPHADVKRDDNGKCDQCLLEGTIICIHCHRIVCRKCRQIYVTDLCGATKGDHVFADLKDNKQRYTKSVDSRASSSQPHTNMNGGSVNEDNNWSCSDTRGLAVVTQRSTVLLSSKVLPNTNGYHSKSSPRTVTRVHVSASGDARYANVKDISSYSGQKSISNESDKRMSTRESARLHDRRDAKYGPTGTSSCEPMEVEQRENSRVSRNDATFQHNGMAEGTYGKTTVQSGVTDLNATLRQQLTIESNVRSAGKESKQVSSTSSEHRRQPGSERVTGAQATGSRAGTLRGAQPPRLLYQIENNVTNKGATRKSGSSAADLKDHSTAKPESKGSPPGPSRRTSAQKDQTPGTSSKNDPQNEISREKRFLEKGTQGAAVCELCGLQGIIVCKYCLIIVCIECMEIYATDLCKTTKGQHAFVRLKDIKTSGYSKAYSSQESGNTNKASGDGKKDWPCSRCTYLNDPEHRICIVCGATRGIGVVESAKPGSRVCRNCTLHNEETAAVCTACHSPLTKSKTVL